MSGVIAAAWLASTGIARAQVNAEAIAKSAAQEGAGLQVGLSGAWATGNLSLLDLRGSVAGQYRRDFATDDAPGPGWYRDRVILSLRGTYLGVSGTTFFDQRLAHLRATHMFRPRIGFGFVTQYENNLVVLLDARITGGAGLAWVATRGKRLSLWGNLGAVIEHEIRNVDPEGPDARLVTNPRWLAHVSWRLALVPERLFWNQSTYLEPRIDDWGDFFVVAYHELQAPVTKALSMTGQVSVRHDPRRPADLAPTDVRIGWGLRLALAASPDDHEPH
ncbi:MAG: DUF481 domain-containing protein [Myxococcota bacterium]